MGEQKSPRIRAVPAVTRAAAILRLLAKNDSPLALKTIAERLDLVPSTALHILRALLAEQLLRFDPETRRYTLGVGLLPLARAALEHSNFPDLARPKLDELSRKHAVTTIATEVPDLNQMIVVAMASAPGPVRLHVDIGSRFPALIHAVGRCVAAFSSRPWQEIEQRFRRLRWDNGPSYETWVREVEASRRDGYNIDNRNYFEGMTLVAAPVLNARGNITHTLAAVGISSRLTRARTLALAREMRTASRRLTAELASGS
jgi:DNA-binding IclR family transcriptional regulator